MAVKQVLTLSLVARAYSEMIRMEDTTCERLNMAGEGTHKLWVKATSADECSEYCTQALDCTAWTWDLDSNLNTHTCKMFFTVWYHDAPLADMRYHDTHAWPISPPCQKWPKIGSISGRPNVQKCIVMDYCMDGTAYRANASSYEECCDLCGSDLLCTSFSFYPEPWEEIVLGKYHMSGPGHDCQISHGNTEDGGEFCGPGLPGLPPQGVNEMSACNLMKDFDGNDEICLGDDLEVDEIAGVWRNNDFAPSWDVCCLRCANTPGCTHWTVNTTGDSGSCHLKTGCTETQTRSAAWVQDRWVPEKSGAVKSKLLIV